MNDHSPTTITVSGALHRELGLRAASRGQPVEQWVEEALWAALRTEDPSASEAAARATGAGDPQSSLDQSPLVRGRELRRSGHSLNAIGKALGMPYAWAQAKLSGVPVDPRTTITRLWIEGLEANQIADALRALRLGFDPADIDRQAERNPHRGAGVDVYRP